jgi:two-component SAPR family response regulator
MNGAELAEVVHRTYPQLAIVFMTAYAEVGPQRLGDWARSSPIILKPCSASDLQEALDQSLRGAQSLRPTSSNDLDLAN